MTQTTKDEASATNNVSLVGKVTLTPELRILPSGDRLVTFRLSVPRTVGRAGARPGTDWFDCAVWDGRVRRSALSWVSGDTVALEGVLRRRHFRTAGGPQTRVEVAVVAGRRLARAGRPVADSDRQ